MGKSFRLHVGVSFNPTTLPDEYEVIFNIHRVSPIIVIKRVAASTRPLTFHVEDHSQIFLRQLNLDQTVSICKKNIFKVIFLL